jgi:hypothetical protein
MAVAMFSSVNRQPMGFIVIALHDDDKALEFFAHLKML